uniref:Protein E6 n=1 Tax=Mops bat papillomavirus TaxID=3141892 RepID=A0AAU7E2L3_9PAPI
MAVKESIKCRFSIHFVLMAGASGDDGPSEVRDAFHPPTIKTLCEQCELSVEEVLLFCQCCWRQLSPYDKFLFEICELTLNWRHGGPYAMCQSCVKLKNQVDFICFSEGTFTATEVERQSNISIYHHQIKCLKCTRPLTFTEVQACVHNFEAFQKVKGELRAICSMCRVF